MLGQLDPFGDIDRVLAEALGAAQRRAMPMDAYQRETTSSPSTSPASTPQPCR